jgi:hypothetical protein
MRNLPRLAPEGNPQFIKRNADGSTEGADPRSLSPENVRDLGHLPKPMLAVLREKCLDCCCYQAIEVRRCTTARCPLWPYRMGTNPFAKPRGSGKPFSRAEPREIGVEISAAAETGTCDDPDGEG